MEMQRLAGVIRSWNPDKRFGWATVDGIDEKFYCTSDQIRQTPPLKVCHLFPGVHVKFTPMESDRGYQALDIEILPARARWNLTVGGETAVKTVGY